MRNTPPPQPVPLEGIGRNLRARRQVGPARCLAEPDLEVVPMPAPRPGYVFPGDTHLHQEPLTPAQARHAAGATHAWTGCDGELQRDQHDLRRAIFGPRDAWCTVCVACGALWWAVASKDSLLDGLAAATCTLKRCDGQPVLSAGLAWVDGVPDAAIDETNAGLIELGMAMRAEVFRKWSAKNGVALTEA